MLNIPKLAMMKGWPLAVQLMIWSCTTSLLLIAGAVAVLYWSLQDYFRRADSSYLTDKVEVLRQELTAHFGNIDRLHSAIIVDPIARVKSRLFLRLLEANGECQLATPGMEDLLPRSDFPIPPMDTHARATIASESIYGNDGARYRVASAAIATASGLGIVQLAYDNIEEKQLLWTYRRWLIGVLAITTGSSIGLGYQLANRGLRPLKRFTATTNEIKPDNFAARINSDGLPRELGSLAISFNRMLMRLEESFVRLNRFSSDIAHELRTPLHNIMGMVEVSLQMPRSDQEYRDTLASCLEEFNRLARLIDTLLFLARAEHPEAVIPRAPIAIDQELLVLRDFYQTAADEAGLSLHVRSEPRLVIAGERELIHRAIGNVVENALYYTFRGGSVSVDASRLDASVLIRVVDSGRGISAEHLPKVFDRLYRVDPSGSSDGHSGLGLAMVKTIVHLHGGSVKIASVPGSGTTVDLLLPVLPPQQRFPDDSSH